MAQFETKVTAVENVWKSPDGQREIFKVTMDYDGQSVQAKTFSKEIATVGWAGTVETYEKESKGDYPAETYVKQPQKEGGYRGGGGGRSNYVPKDEKAIQAMWAIGQAVNLIGPGGADADMAQRVAVTYEVAVQLFAMVDDVKSADSDDSATDKGNPQKVLDEVFEPEETLPEMPENFLKDVEDIFPGTKDATPAPSGEKPWPPKN